MEILINSNPEVVKKQAQEKINSLFIQNSNKPILFLSSGGSCLDLLNNFDFVLPEGLTISVLDERASTDEGENNFAQLVKTQLCKKAPESNCRFIDTRLKEGESKENLEERFERELRNWKDQNPEGIIIATLGIGPDGHISGVPVLENEQIFYSLFRNTTKWVQTFNADELGWDNPFKERVTTTLVFLEQIDYGIAYIIGENKKEALQEALDDIKKFNEVPAKIINKIKDMFIFTNITVEAVKDEKFKLTKRNSLKFILILIIAAFIAFNLFAAVLFALWGSD